jgi:pimeloyl-ACP methyl ester carboxylesterase
VRATLRSGVVVLALGSWADWPVAQPAPVVQTPGALVDVGGHRLYLRCIGPAGATPTVILEAGGGGSSAAWTAVLDSLSPRVRACAYDRAGLGRSEPGPRPRTLRQEVFELRALLEAARVPGPYVLVGHSLGGLLVRLYEERHDADVAGVVLVDPTHESDVLYSLRLGRWVRLRELATGRPVPEPRLGRAPAPAAPPDTAADYLPEEFQQLHLARRARPEPLGDRPLVVLAAGRRPAPPGTPDSVWAPLRREKDAQRAELARLSRNARLVVDPASGHGIPVENPRLVARAIEDVVEAARTGRRLTP